MLVFDVNETLLDIESMAGCFERVFGDRKMLREWFNQLVLHSMAATLSGHYADFFTLADAVLTMVADIHGITLADRDRDSIKDEMRTMPPHPDVAAGLEALSDGAFRLAALTNSPPGQDGQSALDHAGLGGYFERQFSVHAWRLYKPATQLYIDTARELSVAPSECMMVAAHQWDTIGAQSAGYTAALITRPGNEPLRVAGLPLPTLITSDVRELAAQLGC